MRVFSVGAHRPVGQHLIRTINESSAFPPIAMARKTEQFEEY